MRADEGARALLGLEAEAFEPDRFVVLAPDGQRLEGDRLPWRRVARGEGIEGPQAWIDRLSGALRHLLVEGADTTVSLRALHEGPLVHVLASAASRLVARDDPAGLSAPLLGDLAYGLGAELLCVLAGPPGEARLESVHGAAFDGRYLQAALRASTAVADAAGRRAFAFRALEGVDEPWARELLRLELRSACFVPVPVDGMESRVLLVARRTAEPPTAPERRVLESTCELWGSILRRRGRAAAEMRARSSLTALSEAAFEGGHEPPVRELLRLLVVQACHLTHARYGALGVLNRGRTDLADFITVGMSEEQTRRIGHHPRGRGLLGTVIHEGTTIRVKDLSKDPRSAGFPAHHPPMKSFLGVPLRVGREAFGNFYLTDKEGGAEFTEEDARLLESLGAQAALTVAYARETGEQRRLLDAVLDQAPHGIVLFNAPDSITFSNAAARRMLGLPERGPTGRGYRLLDRDGREIPRGEYPAARALAGVRSENVEIQVDLGEGRDPLPLMASAAPVRSETGLLLGAVVALQDLTPFKALERMREEFSATVAHDLRSPLNTMMVQLEALLRKAEGREVRVPVDALLRMRHSGTRLQHLISDLLDAARIEGGRVSLDRRPVSLPALASNLANLISPTLKGRTLQVRIDGVVPPVAADPMRVEQVLTNLLENAARYSAEGTTIELTVSGAEGGVLASVRDRGPGIPAESLTRIFERNYRARRARSERTGLGLGLFIAKGLVEAHGGRIWAESTLGEGSTFHVWIPGQPAPEAAQEHRPSP